MKKHLQASTVTYISSRNTTEGKTKGFNAVSVINLVLAYPQEAQQNFHLIQVSLSYK